MAIEPTRPIGSSHTLLFTGDLVLGTAVMGAIPTGAAATRNAVVGSDVAAATKTGVRFLLGDATDPTDKSTTLPAYIFDDAQPAGASPHAPAVTAGLANVYLATDLVMGATWTKNLDVRVTAANATDQALITDVDYAGIVVVLDEGATSGLGLSTGLPVVIIPMTFGQAAAAWGASPITVRVEITVRHTTGR